MERHIDHNQETITTVPQITETTDITKDIETRLIIITIEMKVIIETIIIGVEPTVITETIIIIDTTIVDQAQDTQTAATQDSIHHTTETKIIVRTIIIDKDVIVNTQTEVTDTDNDHVLRSCKIM